MLTTICCLSVLCVSCTQIAVFSQSACLLTRVPVECVNIFTVMLGAIDFICLYGCWHSGCEFNEGQEDDQANHPQSG